jgi:hypothetical protein
MDKDKTDNEQNENNGRKKNEQQGMRKKSKNVATLRFNVKSDNPLKYKKVQRIYRLNTIIRFSITVELQIFQMTLAQLR